MAQLLQFVKNNKFEQPTILLEKVTTTFFSSLADNGYSLYKVSEAVAVNTAVTTQEQLLSSDLLSESFTPEQAEKLNNAQENKYNINLNDLSFSEVTQNQFKYFQVLPTLDNSRIKNAKFTYELDTASNININDNGYVTINDNLDLGLHSFKVLCNTNNATTEKLYNFTVVAGSAETGAVATFTQTGTNIVNNLVNGTHAATQSVTTGAGENLELSVVISNDAVESVTLVNGGSGHAVGDSVTVTINDTDQDDELTINVDSIA